MPAKKPSQQIQTGRSLPPKVSAYSPGRRQAGPLYPPTNELPTKKWPSRLRRMVAGLLLVIIGLCLFIGIWDARNISAATNKLTGSGNILSLLNASSLKSDSNGRVNVLIAGYSADDPGHAGATLTDSIMLLSMNPTKHTGYMLSIPRDLYVNLGSQNCKQGTSHCKINEAYEDGGMNLLIQTVQSIFDTQIGYYALVDYATVRSVVDAVGGIDVTINSPAGRLYDPNKDWLTGGPLVDLSNGWHHLDGEQALDLARARGDPSPYGIAIGLQNDYQRTANQRLVFTAIKSKLNWKLVLDPRKNGKILNAIADNVKTDISIDEVRPLFGLFNSIPSSNLKSLSLDNLDGKNYFSGLYTYSGDSVIPAAGIDDYSQINQALASYNQQ